MDSVLEAYAESEPDSEPEPEPQRSKRTKRRATVVHDPDEVQDNDSESESDSEPEPEPQISKRTKRVVHEPDELQDNDSDDEDQSRKKRAPNADRDFQLVAEWSREEMDDETILVHIRKHLDDLNSSAGIQVLPCSHKDRKNVFGTFQFRRKWVTGKGRVLNTIVNFPLQIRCKCRCQAKIVETQDTTFLYIADAHTVADHVAEKDASKYLKFSTAGVEEER